MLLSFGAEISKKLGTWARLIVAQLIFHNLSASIPEISDVLAATTAERS